MDTLEAIFARRSVRAFKPDIIPDEDLKQILEAGRQAPSASNRQPWHFVVVSDPERKQRVAEAFNRQMFVADASHILVAASTPTASPRWHRVDVAIALENMVLAAQSLGYGTCWIGAFDGERLKAICELPDAMEVVACMPIGVPAVHPPARGRKEWEEVFSAERYGNLVEL